MDTLGLVGTTSPGGAGKWRSEYGDALRGGRVVVIADKDAPGRAHAEGVATDLLDKAASIKVIELPGEMVKDASDWLSAGGTKAELLSIAATAPQWRAARAEPSASHSGLAEVQGDVLAQGTSDLDELPYLPFCGVDG
jgi:hypothetical protein